MVNPCLVELDYVETHCEPNNGDSLEWIEAQLMEDDSSLNDNLSINFLALLEDQMRVLEKQIWENDSVIAGLCTYECK